jgi:hypothetical protein
MAAQVDDGELAVPARASRRGAGLVGQRAVQRRRPGQGVGSGVVCSRRGLVDVEVPTAARWRRLMMGHHTGGGWHWLAHRGAV